MSALHKLFSSAIHLFYPHICSGCGSDLLNAEELLCLRCIEALPHTGFEKYQHNPIERIFYGQVPLVNAHSGFYFTKGELVQQLIHELKYKGNKEIGIYLSKITGDKMMDAGRFRDIDYLIPLPMFADKEFKRGYNQATIICDGLSSAMNIPVLNNNVIRSLETSTQTKKHRAERWDNVSESFTIKDADTLQHKHILLADDVITTGATLEACAQLIHAIGNVRISIVTLATATK